MNYDGVWLAVYTAEGSPFGSGIIILRDGKAVGGDNQYLFDGTYQLRSDGSIAAQLEVTHYAGPGLSVFQGAPPLKFSLDLTGLEIAGTLQLEGVMRWADRPIRIAMTRWIRGL